MTRTVEGPWASTADPYRGAEGRHGSVRRPSGLDRACATTGLRTCPRGPLNAGLIDEISINLVPVLLGEGIRFFDHLVTTPTELEGPSVVEGRGVTHLSFRVKAKAR